MKTPDRPVKPDFEKASDAVSAWREQQKALLNEQERQTYEQIVLEKKQEETARARELATTRHQRLQDEKQRQLLFRKTLTLDMIRSTKRVSEREAEAAAKEIVHANDTATIQALADQTTKAGDQFLQEREQQRTSQRLERAFQRAAATKTHREKGDKGRER